MEEERKLDLHGNVQLRFEIFELRFFGAQEEAIVIQSYFAKCHCIPGLFGLDGQCPELVQQLGWAAREAIELLCLTRMNANRGITEARWKTSEIGLLLLGRLGSHTVLLSYLDSVTGFFQIRARNHELQAADVTRTFDDIVQVILVGLFSMIVSCKDRIPEINPNLGFGLVANPRRSGRYDSRPRISMACESHSS